MNTSRNIGASMQILEEIVTRIVEHFDPQGLILFGSHARGEAREDSDFDLLIIAPSNEPRWRRTVPVYRLLAGLGVPKDIIWWTPEEIAEWRDVKSHLIHRALQEGEVLYGETPDSRRHPPLQLHKP